jgi:hypothetical protein
LARLGGTGGGQYAGRLFAKQSRATRPGEEALKVLALIGDTSEDEAVKAEITATITKK